jgi:hypothetical protein
VEDRRASVIEVSLEIVYQRRIRGIRDELTGDAVDEISVLPLAACGMAGANGPDEFAGAVRRPDKRLLVPEAVDHAGGICQVA